MPGWYHDRPFPPRKNIAIFRDPIRQGPTAISPPVGPASVYMRGCASELIMLKPCPSPAEAPTGEQFANLNNKQVIVIEDHGCMIGPVG